LQRITGIRRPELLSWHVLIEGLAPLLFTEAELDARKLRGAFFTPQPIAAFLAAWAIRHHSDTIFEPSCGEAIFLGEAVSRLQMLGNHSPSAEQIQGTDIDEASVEAAKSLLTQLGAQATLSAADFFDVHRPRLFSTIIGNPPYVRYQTHTGPARAKGLEAALAQGVRLSALASSWAAFVIHAASFLEVGGRLALVLPAELLTVNYAAPVRRFLMERFASVKLVVFEERVFPGVMEEVVLLLAEGTGPTDHCDLIQTKNASTLGAVDGQKWTPADTRDKWITGLLKPEAASLYGGLVNDESFSPLKKWGETNLGMVTGNNHYFTLSAAKVKELGLRRDELMKICPPGSRHLRGLGFTEKAWEEMLLDGAAGYLFDPDNQNPSDAARAYIAAGEVQGVEQAYKCRVRSPWWRVPRVQVPDAFFTYMNHDTPRIVTNRAGLAYLNSIHGITFARERRQLAMDLLPMAALNTATLLGAELVGRSYGGGLLKVEPNEADQLPVPSLTLVERAEASLRALRPQLAKALRQGKLLDVVVEVDRVLRPHLKISAADLKELRAARAALFNRRVSRSKGDR
jgi:adenine-specific DNA-methyltransferase